MDRLGRGYEGFYSKASNKVSSPRHPKRLKAREGRTSLGEREAAIGASPLLVGRTGPAPNGRRLRDGVDHHRSERALASPLIARSRSVLREILISYLSAVYPAAATSLRTLSSHSLNRSFEQLDYLYVCDSTALRPPLPAATRPTCPTLPYRPAGAYYSTAGRTHAPALTFSGGNFFRYPEPIEVWPTAGLVPSRSTLPRGEQIHSGNGGRSGPTPGTLHGRRPPMLPSPACTIC